MTAQPSNEPHISKRDIIQFKPERDSANDIRNALLVASALIAAATFASGVNPPGGVWQDNANNHVAGKSVLASHSKDSFDHHVPFLELGGIFFVYPRGFLSCQ